MKEIRKQIGAFSKNDLDGAPLSAVRHAESSASSP